MDKIPFLILGSESDISGGHIYNRKIAEHICVLELIYKKEEKDFFEFITWYSNQRKEGSKKVMLIDGWALHNAQPIPLNIDFYLIVHLPLALYDLSCSGVNKEYSFWETAKGVIVPSEQVATFVRSKTNTKVVCVAPGIELNSARSERSDLLPEKGREKLDIVGLGSYVKKKGDELLLKALSEVSYPFKLTRIGSIVDVAYYEYLLSLIEAYRLQGKVQLLPAVSHVDAISILSKSDVAVFPTCYESYGMAIQESIALGIPVLASDLDELRNRFGMVGIKYLERTIESWSLGVNQCFNEYIAGVGLFRMDEAVGNSRFPNWKQQSKILMQVMSLES